MEKMASVKLTKICFDLNGADQKFPQTKSPTIKSLKDAII